MCSMCCWSLDDAVGPQSPTSFFSFIFLLLASCRSSVVYMVCNIFAFLLPLSIDSCISRRSIAHGMGGLGLQVGFGQAMVRLQASTCVGKNNRAGMGKSQMPGRISGVMGIGKCVPGWEF